MMDVKAHVTKEFKIGDIVVIVKYDDKNRIIYRKYQHDGFEEFVTYDEYDKVTSIISKWSNPNISDEIYEYNPSVEQSELDFFCDSDCYKNIEEYKYEYETDWNIISSSDECIILHAETDLGECGILERWIECYLEANIIRYHDTTNPDNYYDGYGNPIM